MTFAKPHSEQRLGGAMMVRDRIAMYGACAVIAASAGLLVACDDGASGVDAEQAAGAAADAARPAAAPEPQVDAEPEGLEWEPYEGVYRAGVREAPATPDGAVRLMSYNVLNLFDDVDDPDYEGDVDDMHNRWDNLRQKPTEQLEAAAETIRACDPDVIGLQEIESEAALLWFRDNYLSGMGYAYHVSEDVGHARGIEQAVLSRFPIVEHETWPRMPLGESHPEDPQEMQRREREKAGQEIVFRRSPLFALIQVPADANGAEAAPDAEPYELGVFVIHHKSGWQNDYWREAEAAAIRTLIADMQQAHPDRNIALIGDFNAEPHETSVRLYRDELGLIDTMADRSGDDEAFITHASGRAIDFILVNPALEREVVPESAFVYATPLRPEDFDWRTTPPPIGYVSDHMPVVVDLRVGDR
jgi:endonuclease/exonuclease/phosphatase family metal-dependent hydrolase